MFKRIKPEMCVPKAEVFYVPRHLVANRAIPDDHEGIERGIITSVDAGGAFVRYYDKYGLKESSQRTGFDDLYVWST